jgi:alkanesulfonate monooxygenase SsuD/methylene tetrahydromethanopterin reductase-like flavin-dependent oxidoreductase (luciferase family)
VRPITPGNLLPSYSTTGDDPLIGGFWRGRAPRAPTCQAARVRIGVCVIPTDPWPVAVRTAQDVETLGFDHLWTYDHLSWQHYRDAPWFSAFPWLAGIAGATTTLRLGTLVCSPNFREPLTLAKDAIALDHVSAGRFVLGVGAGGLGWDATVYGREPLAPGPRAARFAEMVEALDGLLTRREFSFRGAFYEIADARTTPGPLQEPRLPLAVAAAGPKGIALAARFADAWITLGDPWSDESPAGIERAVGEQSARLDDECERIGRNPASVDRILLSGAGDDRPLASIAAVEDYAGRYRNLGITDLVVHQPRAGDPHWDDPPDMLERVGAILPALRNG